jgi:hypothetical protein
MACRQFSHRSLPTIVLPFKVGGSSGPTVAVTDFSLMIQFDPKTLGDLTFYIEILVEERESSP